MGFRDRNADIFSKAPLSLLKWLQPREEQTRPAEGDFPAAATALQ